ncbi:MAG: phosphatase [Tissierellia bacterium]|nr:phosphatase [Tissierellia bacterium]
MKLLCDLHTHTFVSGHAYSSLKDNIQMARERGLKFLGTSEHAERMPGSVNNVYFYNMKILKRDYGGIYLLRGAEANIMDYEGNLDLEKEKHIKNLDYIIASLHTPCIEDGGIGNNTRALIAAMDREKVRIIGHPDDDRYPIDRRALVQAAKEKGILLELNNSSLSPVSSRTNARENIVELLGYAADYGADIIINSDAHVDHQVGDFTLALDIIAEMGFPRERVVNFDETEKRLFRYLKVDGETFFGL